MPTAFTEHVETTPPPHKRWTRAEYQTLASTGVWDLQHYELVDGELVSKMGKKRPHTNTLTALFEWLLEVFGKGYVQPEAPIDVAPEDNPTNEPEPDLIVLVKPFREYRTGNPKPADLRLVIEVADSTLGFDLREKATLYARAGISDYWVVDVVGRRIIVHRDPHGEYRSVVSYQEHESVSPFAAPGHAFAVREAF
jgi:Uma2 family endonuclease